MEEEEEEEPELIERVYFRWFVNKYQDESFYFLVARSYMARETSIQLQILHVASYL